MAMLQKRKYQIPNDRLIDRNLIELSKRMELDAEEIEQNISWTLINSYRDRLHRRISRTSGSVGLSYLPVLKEQYDHSYD